MNFGVSNKSRFLTSTMTIAKLRLYLRKMHSLSVSQQQQFGEVVEEHTNGVITELVSKAIFVAVVHPFADPDHGHSCWVFTLLCKYQPEDYSTA